MSGIRLAELERITSLARTVVAPLAETWSSNRNVTVRIEAPQAERATATAIAAGLEGQYWLLPIEVTGVHNGVMCVLIPHAMDPGAGVDPGDGFVAMIDDFLARGSDRLTATLGGPVSLDRLGLREAPALALAGGLAEALGTADLVAVHFEAEMPAAAPGGGGAGDMLVVFGGRLLKELTSRPAGLAETVPSATGKIPAAGAAPQPHQSAAVATLLARARGLTLTVSAEIGRRNVTLRELLGMGIGCTVGVGRAVTQPIELYVGARRIANADAVVVGDRLGVRLRART